MTEPQEHGSDLQAKLERSVSRRALVKAGWALPVVLASASLPKAVFAQSSGGEPCPPSGFIETTNEFGETVFIPCGPGGAG